MRVQSFMRQGIELVPIEIELRLQPGLPLIHFLGLPDQAVRESALRIRSAIRSQGFRLPQAQQILVQLRPNHVRKTSLGLDLAVAAALLWETEQIPKFDGRPVLYGALTLEGAVEAPLDVREIHDDAGIVATGVVEEDLPFTSLQLRELRDLAQPARALRYRSKTTAWRRPNAPVESFPSAVAELGAIIATGEHAALLAGPPGSGKSTLADSIPAWLEEPRGVIARSGASWRPVVRPHHTISRIAMVGGGSTGWAGEITRAHGGVLVMDELLEFSAEIQEALREPIEAGVISVARGGVERTYPARFVLIGTTNLCECGRFVPRAQSDACRCPRPARRRALSRMTGPFVDRFSILAYSDQWKESSGSVPADEIGERVAGAVRFRINARKQAVSNAFAATEEIEASLSDFQRRNLIGELESGSIRRRQSVFRVARTIADLRGSLAISNVDLDRALELANQGHQWLAEWRH